MHSAICLQDFVFLLNLALQAGSSSLFRALIFQENRKMRSMLFQLIISKAFSCDRILVKFRNISVSLFALVARASTHVTPLHFPKSFLLAMS